MQAIAVLFTTLLVLGCAGQFPQPSAVNPGNTGAIVLAVEHVATLFLEGGHAGAPGFICLAVAESRSERPSGPTVQASDAPDEVIERLDGMPLPVVRRSACGVNPQSPRVVVGPDGQTPALEVRYVPQPEVNGQLEILVEAILSGREAEGYLCNVRRSAGGWELQGCSRAWQA